MVRLHIVRVSIIDEQWTWHDGYGQQPYVAHDANVVSESVANEIACQIQLSLNPRTP